MSAPPVLEVPQELTGRIDKDVRLAAERMSVEEARYIVQLFYSMQDERIASNNQAKALQRDERPNHSIDYISRHFAALEHRVALLLRAYAQQQQICRWMMAQKGIAHVIASGLRAHINIHRCKNPSALWDYAGLNPHKRWPSRAEADKWVRENMASGSKASEEVIAQAANDFGRNPAQLRALVGQTPSKVAAGLAKKPFNGELKTLCWKLGESFVKVSGFDDALYGRLYRERKLEEAARNDAGEFEQQAQAKLETMNIGKSTEAYAWYAAGKLPPAHVHARAKRWTVKVFLDHLYRRWHGLEKPHLPLPRPWIIEHGGHSGEIEPPPMVD